MAALKILDLRNVFKNCTDTLIEIGDPLIYYAEEKMEEGHPSLFLLEYNRAARRERIVANYILTDPAFVPHFFSFPDDIVMVLESGGSEAWVLRVDKRTGREKSMARLNFIGSFLDCRALDEDHMLFYTGPNNRHRALFSEYSRLTGFSRVCYLYDLEEGKYYYARDPRVCGADASRLLTCECGGALQVLLLEPHGSEAEKEKCYRNMRWLGDGVCDRVWLCPLLDFVVSVKTGEPRVPLELILNAGTEGLVRYAGMNRENIYFRARYFPTGDQRLCAYNRATGRKSVAARLTLGRGERPARFSIDPEGGRAYRIEERDDDCEVTGVLNSGISVRYPKELGRFVTCVDDRYIVAKYILKDDRDSFEFNSLFDGETGYQKSYECHCAVRGETVVLY